MASLIKRGNTYSAQYMVGKKTKRITLETSSLQLAKDKLRTLESSLFRGNDNPFPTKTPIATVVTRYVEYMLATKTAKSAEKDISYLRISFGQICPELELKNIKNSAQRNKDSSKLPPVYHAGFPIHAAGWFFPELYPVLSR
jgi:hypothetical protein